MFGNIDRKKDQLIAKLQTCSKMTATDSSFHQICELKNEVAEIEARQECMWRQQARLDWLQDGDNNTKFFHSVASNRRKQNHIDRIQDATGRWVDVTEQVS